MAVPINYRKSGDTQAIYDFTDIANNTGYEVYYLSNNYKQSGASLVSGDPFLDTLLIPSQNDTVSVPYEFPDVGSGTSKAFDVPFQISRGIKGDVICYIPHYFSSGAGNSGTGTLLLELYSVKSGTETFIVSGATTSRASVANTTQAYTEIIRLPVTTRKKIPSGSSLRFKVTFYHSVDAGAGTRHIYADPSNSSTTQSRIYIPFTLDQ